MKSKTLLAAFIVLAAFLYFVVFNHHSDDKIIQLAKQDIVQKGGAFQSLHSFCKQLATEKSSDIYFYYREGWDYLGIELTDTAGLESTLKIAPPGFLSQLYFETVNVTVQYKRAQDLLIVKYPYSNYKGQFSRLLHVNSAFKEEVFAGRSRVVTIGENWYLEFYDLAD